MTALDETNGADALAALKIIDCDAHLTEPPDLWESRAPKSLRDRVPAMRTVDGVSGWYMDGEVWASTGGNTIVAGGKKQLGTVVLHPFEDIDPAAWSVDARIKLMDQIGVYAQICYPNAIGFSSNHIFAIEDLALRQAVLEIYNDFCVDVQTESGGRLLPQALPPIWDIDLTVKELSRLISKGITGFTLTDRPELLGLPELDDPHYDPMWGLFNESGVVANFHIGSGMRKEDVNGLRGAAKSAPAGGGKNVPAVAPLAWSSLGQQRTHTARSTQHFMSNVRIIVNLCLSDLFDRFPRLKIVSAESGVGWVPFILEALDYQFDEMVTLEDELAHTKRRPSEYFREHLYVTLWFEQTGVADLIRSAGIVNNVLVETDIPHPTCLYPDPLAQFERSLSGLAAGAQKRILHDNAAELYGLEVPPG